MRFFSLLAVFFLLTPALAQAKDANVPDLQDQKYYACAADAECAVINMPCGGHDSVNRKYQGEVQVWADQIAMLAKCRAPEVTAVPAPHCTANRCTMDQPPAQ